MKAIVNKETCTGCELCPQTCPEVFKMEGDTAVSVMDQVPAEVEKKCRQAAEECPVTAISIQEG